jgi:alpha-amylase/alpha-mannosidase (GH57 family)
MEKYVCIHGHFYQPPRENPWLEAIELQDSAYPYHDWNERITAECYAPNAVSRILRGDDSIERIVNNYSSISFNFGPTLLRWLEEKAPEVYGAIQAADRDSQAKFSGHGSAISQAYNHMIMPLGDSRDKRTQVKWGIRDFEHRFGRRPEGMWLPETAVDLETLDILAEHGILFTVLSPYQARQVRAIGGRSWRDVRDGKIDPSRAYRQNLKSGRSIALFFYDGPVSQAVAFEKLLARGEYLANRLIGTFSDKRDWPQLAHIATDGETYGHHHPHGDMGLAYAIHLIETNSLARLTNYGEFLEKHPPTHDVGILENTAWSCVHGVDRWLSDCGCNSGGNLGWNQKWRQPLRAALDWLRDTLAAEFENSARQLLRDPWNARDEYISVVLDRSRENVDRFFHEQAQHPLNPEEQVRALKLLEMQRHAMLMYTSCGWFFDELSGIETVQVMQYASRALQLSEHLSGNGKTETFLQKLAEARSNIAEHGDGRQVYEKFVAPAQVDLPKVGVHYAITSLFKQQDEVSKIYCYDVQRHEHQLLTAGDNRLLMGRAQIASTITRDSTELTFGAAHFGDQNVVGGVRQFQGSSAYEELKQELRAAFDRGDTPDVLRTMDHKFDGGTSTLKHLFRDEQRETLHKILDTKVAAVTDTYRPIYEQNAALMRYLTSLNIPLPRSLQVAAEITLNAQIVELLRADKPDQQHLDALLNDAKIAGLRLDEATLEFAVRKKLEAVVRQSQQQPGDLDRLTQWVERLQLAQRLPFTINLWTSQNQYYKLLQTQLPGMRARENQSDAEAQQWVEKFSLLGKLMGIHVE